MSNKLAKNAGQSMMLLKEENNQLRIHNRQLSAQLKKAKEEYNILNREYRSATQFLWIAARQQDGHRLQIPDSLQLSSLQETSVLRLEKDKERLYTYLIAETEEEHKATPKNLVEIPRKKQ